MKKVLVCLISLLIVLAVASCGGTGGGNSDGGTTGDIDINSFNTIGDVLALEAENYQYGTSENTFVYGFQMDGSYYRFKAEMTEDQKDAYFNIDYSEEDYEEQETALISEFVITDRQVMDDLILSQEELDSLTGKTGQELFESGWTPGFGYNLAEGEFWLDNGPFCYTVRFDGDFNEIDDVDDVAEFLKDYTVSSAEFREMGDVTNW